MVGRAFEVEPLTAMNSRVWMVVLVSAVSMPAAGCAREPSSCDELLERASDAFAQCGYDLSFADEGEECTEDFRRGLECSVSCEEAASCDALLGASAEAVRPLITCMDFCNFYF